MATTALATSMKKMDIAIGEDIAMFCLHAFASISKNITHSHIRIFLHVSLDAYIICEGSIKNSTKRMKVISS